LSQCFNFTIVPYIRYTSVEHCVKGDLTMNDPRQHTNEEPRNDLIDVGIGFVGMFVLLLLIAGTATVIELLTR
jgi:hypothetical protein